MSSDIQVVGPAEVEPASFWDALTQNAPRIDSGILVKDEDLAKLENVPFAVTKVNYREGDIVREGADGPDAYTSLTITIADEKMLRKLERMKRLVFDDLPFLPEETVIFNDGSTGVKRQITEFLHIAGYIHVVADGTPLKPGGGRGESSFDSSPIEWAAADKGRRYETESGFVEYEVALNPALVCVRGLRPSTYSNKYTKEGLTWYLA